MRSSKKLGRPDGIGSERAASQPAFASLENRIRQFHRRSFRPRGRHQYFKPQHSRFERLDQKSKWFDQAVYGSRQCGADKGWPVGGPHNDGLNLKERAEVQQLADAENRDRESLYLEIAKANNFPKESVSKIKSIFAKSWAEQAQSGWWIQDAQGNWEKK